MFCGLFARAYTLIERRKMYDLQKASFWKRISAYILDFILIVILAVGVGFLLSSVFKYDSYVAKSNDFMLKYAQENSLAYSLAEVDDLGNAKTVSLDDYYAMSEKDRVKVTVTIVDPTAFEALTEADISSYEKQLGIDLHISKEDYQARYEAADKAISADGEFQRVSSMLVNLSLVVTSLSLLVAFALLEFVVPVLFGNGQTLGKKVFSIGVMQFTGVKISTLSLFIRTVFGKFTIGTMIPVLCFILFFFEIGGIVPAFLIFVILAVQLAMVLTSKNRYAIHDMLASTVVVDMHSQMIFESKEALIEYQARLARERADNSD